MREIWNGREMNEIRRLVLRTEYDRVDACRGCSEARRPAAVRIVETGGME